MQEKSLVVAVSDTQNRHRNISIFKPMTKFIFRRKRFNKLIRYNKNDLILSDYILKNGIFFLFL